MDVLLKLMVSAVVFVMFFIPTWIFISAWYIFNPSGFWQKFVLGYAGILMLGGIQFILAIFFLAFLLKIWFTRLF